MQAPLIVFDHIRQVVHTIPTGLSADKRLADVLAAQQKQIATSGRPPQ